MLKKKNEEHNLEESESEDNVNKPMIRIIDSRDRTELQSIEAELIS
jgi:hypothetical protein